MHQQPRTIDPPRSPNSASRSAQFSGVSGRVLKESRPGTGSAPREAGRALLGERGDSLPEVGRGGPLLLDLRLELELIGYVLVEPAVELALDACIGASRPFGQLGAQRFRLPGQLRVGPDLVDEPPVKCPGG